jgi:competence ComEA-like helix-hairpin-helix protein
MSPSRADRYDLAWRRGDLPPLIALCLLAGAACVCAALGRRVWFASGPTIDSARIALAAEKIDPNTATVASLRRLGGIGPVKARAIVQYREQEGRQFLRPEDLANVPGIGPKIVRRISPHLAFPQRGQ